MPKMLKTHDNPFSPNGFYKHKLLRGNASLFGNFLESNLKLRNGDLPTRSQQQSWIHHDWLSRWVSFWMFTPTNIQMCYRPHDIIVVVSNRIPHLPS
jgi:hypothetical protein